MENTTTNTSLIRELSNQMADTVNHVSTAVVLVNGRERQPASGVVFSDNLILTADHVLE